MRLDIPYDDIFTSCLIYEMTPHEIFRLAMSCRFFKDLIYRHLIKIASIYIHPKNWIYLYKHEHFLQLVVALPKGLYFDWINVLLDANQYDLLLSVIKLTYKGVTTCNIAYAFSMIARNPQHLKDVDGFISTVRQIVQKSMCTEWQHTFFVSGIMKCKSLNDNALINTITTIVLKSISPNYYHILYEHEPCIRLCMRILPIRQKYAIGIILAANKKNDTTLCRDAVEYYKSIPQNQLWTEVSKQLITVNSKEVLECILTHVANISHIRVTTSDLLKMIIDERHATIDEAVSMSHTTLTCWKVLRESYNISFTAIGTGYDIFKTNDADLIGEYVKTHILELTNGKYYRMIIVVHQNDILYFLIDEFKITPTDVEKILSHMIANKTNNMPLIRALYTTIKPTFEIHQHIFKYAMQCHVSFVREIINIFVEDQERFETLLTRVFPYAGYEFLQQYNITKQFLKRIYLCNSHNREYSLAQLQITPNVHFISTPWCIEAEVRYIQTKSKPEDIEIYKRYEGIYPDQIIWALIERYGHAVLQFLFKGKNVKEYNHLYFTCLKYKITLDQLKPLLTVVQFNNYTTLKF